MNDVQSMPQKQAIHLSFVEEKGFDFYLESTFSFKVAPDEDGRIA